MDGFFFTEACMIVQRKHQYANCDETDEDIFYFLYLCILNFTIMGEYYYVIQNSFL